MIPYLLFLKSINLSQNGFMNNVTNKGILSFFIKNFVLSTIYNYGMVGIYFSNIKIEGLFIEFYQMVFTIIHIIVLLILLN